VFVFVIGGLLPLAAPFAWQGSALVTNLPTYTAQVRGRITDLQAGLQTQGILLDLNSIRSQATNAVEDSANVVLRGLIGEAAALGGALADAILVLVISVYLLTGAPTIQRNALQVVPHRYRGAHMFVQTTAARVMGGYLRRQLIMCLVD
jgi:predicted PurR-regulated permease PerM